MKRGTPHHPKMRALAVALKIGVPCAVGTMEMLWHYVATVAPRGDIGVVTDKEIAAAVCWDKKPKILIDALVAVCWLDRDDKSRLIVHDWPDHADNATRKKLQHSGRDFLPVYGKSVVKTDDVDLKSQNSPDDSKAETSFCGKPETYVSTAKAKGIGLGSSLETTTCEETTSRARGENYEIYPEDPVETFVVQAVSRERPSFSLKLTRKADELIVERLRQAERQAGMSELRSAWMVYLRWWKTEKQQEIDSPLPYFLNSLSRWLDSAPIQPIAYTPHSVDHRGYKSVSSALTAQDSQDGAFLANSWNEANPDSRTEWDGYAPKAQMAECLKDPNFREKWPIVCELAARARKNKPESGWITLPWVLSKGKEGKPPGWYRLLNDLRWMSQDPPPVVEKPKSINAQIWEENERAIQAMEAKRK